MDTLDDFFEVLFAVGLFCAFVAWIVPLGYGLSWIAMIAAWFYTGSALIWALFSRIAIRAYRVYVNLRNPTK